MIAASCRNLTRVVSRTLGRIIFTATFLEPPGVVQVAFDTLPNCPLPRNSSRLYNTKNDDWTFLNKYCSDIRICWLVFWMSAVCGHVRLCGYWSCTYSLTPAVLWGFLWTSSGKAGHTSLRLLLLASSRLAQAQRNLFFWCSPHVVSVKQVHITWYTSQARTDDSYGPYYKSTLLHHSYFQPYGFVDTTIYSML